MAMDTHTHPRPIIANVGSTMETDLNRVETPSNKTTIHQNFTYKLIAKTAVTDAKNIANYYRNIHCNKTNRNR